MSLRHGGRRLARQTEVLVEPQVLFGIGMPVEGMHGLDFSASPI